MATLFEQKEIRWRRLENIALDIWGHSMPDVTQAREENDETDEQIRDFYLLRSKI
jgi:hypothetical protein